MILKLYGKKKPRTLQEKIDWNYMPVTETGCWIWLCKTDKHGYGRFGPGKLTHRVSYELYRGAIPKDMTLDHICRVRCCINPEHLRLASWDEARKQAHDHWRSRTHCVRGHEYSEANTGVNRNGKGISRYCKACRKLQVSR